MYLNVLSLSLPPGLKNRRWVERLFFSLAGVAWVVAFLFFWQADTMPLIKRDALFMNAPWSLVGIAFIGAVAVSAPFVFLFWTKSRWYAVLVVTLLLGQGIMLAITQGGLCLNAWLDGAVPESHLTQVVDKKRISGRYGASWVLLVRDWRRSKSSVSLRSNPDEYAATPIGSPLVVTTRYGFFGWEWLVRREFNRDRPTDSSPLTPQ